MKRFEELLLDTIKNDINYLFQEVYLSGVRNSRKYLNDEYFARRFDAVANKSKYSLSDISTMSGINVTESYMLDLIKSFCDDSDLFSAFNKINRVKLIPMFKYFIDKDINNARLMGSFFLPIHCSGQMTNAFLNKKFSTKPIFKVNYTLISGIEHSIGSKDLRFDLGSAIYHLNFINYERNNAFTHIGSEYFNRLNSIALELENFLSFYGNDDLLIKYNARKNIFAFNKENYSDDELKLSFDNLNLIKHFYDGSFQSYPNKVYELKKIEEDIANSANKKELLLASFCYRKYCDDDFFRSFDDVKLNVGDVFDFISECERANLKVTNTQINNLLASFKKYYLIKNNLVEDYENEKQCILEAYDRYCTRNWVFEKDDFINFFNSLYGKKFKTFGFDTKEGSLLTPEILDEVIGDNKFVGFEKIKNTNIGRMCLNDFSQTDREKYCCDTEHRRELFKQYYDLISEYCRDPKVTVHYFIYHSGVPVEDEKTIEQLIDWCYTNSGFTSDFYSESLKKNTDIEIRENFKNDLLANFRENKNIFNRYISIIENDGITKYGTLTMVRRVNVDTRKEQISKLTDDVVKRANMMIDNGLTGWDFFDDLDLSQDDIRHILNRNGIEWSKIAESSSNKPRDTEPLLKNVMFAVIEYISSDLSIMDVCNKYGCLPGSMNKYVTSHMKSDPEVFEKFHSKAAENNECIDNSYIDVDHIVDKITNGVTMPNGESRKYTYFDLIMDIGHNVDLYEIKKLLNKDYPNNYFVGNFFSTKNFFGSVYYSCNLKNFGPFPYQIRSGAMTFNINGEQHTVTDEEREAVLGFLEKRKLPSCLYYDAVKAYLNGEFDPNKKIPNKRMVKIAEKSES